MTSRHRTVIGLISAGLLVVSACGSGQAIESPSTTSTAPDTAPTSLTVTTTSSSPSTTVISPTTTLGEEVAPPADLLIMGDWGSGTLPQGAVAGAMQRYADGHDVTAILTTGDNFYSDDVEFLMQPYGWVDDSGLDWWIAWGNHDVENTRMIEAVNETFDSPPRWSVRTWGDVDVIVLDSNQVTSLEQGAFLLNAMATSDRPTIVVLHHPPYSCSHHGSTTEVVNQFVSLLDDDVVLVLSGHDHSYQRFENDGIAYVVTGGGGQDIRPLSDCPSNHPERLAGAELHHFVALSQRDDAVQMTVFDVNGEVIDQLSLPLP